MSDNRFAATLNWISSMARLGVRNVEFRIEVPVDEWVKWISDVTSLRTYGVKPCGIQSLNFWGPSSIMCVVSVRRN